MQPSATTSKWTQTSPQTALLNTAITPLICKLAPNPGSNSAYLNFQWHRERAGPHVSTLEQLWDTAQWKLWSIWNLIGATKGHQNEDNKLSNENEVLRDKE